MTIGVFVVVHEYNKRIIKVESRDINQDLRLVWTKINTLDKENIRRDHRITNLESEEYFDFEDDIEYDELDDDEEEEDCDDGDSIYIHAESAVESGRFVYLGKSYRVTIDKNEG
jgi:hypothetical protein